MKLLTTLLFIFFIQLVFGQKDFRESFEEVKQYDFAEYGSIYYDETGKRILSGRYYSVKLSEQLNRFGHLNGLKGIDVESGTERITYNYVFDFFDNYTHPAFLRNRDSKKAMLFIDSCLFVLKDVSTDATEFSIDAIWVPKLHTGKSEEVEGEKKKLSLKEKMAELKSSFQEDPFKAKFESLDMDSLVTAYILSMKEVQKENPLDATAKSQNAALEFTSDSTQMAWKGKNDEYWMSEAGQKVRAAMREKQGLPTNWTIKNVSGKTINIGTYGQTHVVNNGSTIKIWCSDDAYYSYNDNGSWKHKGLIGKGSEHCGTTLEIH